MSISTASPATISAIQQAVQAVLARVSMLIETVTAAIGQPTTFGGVVAGAPPQASANALIAATTNTMQLWSLLQLQCVLGRLLANLEAVNSSPNTVTSAGGNLFALAQDEYGDPTDWTAIASANDLIDPFIQGVETLTIPPTPVSNGGVLTS